MNFYQSSLISLITFTLLFYLHWNRFDSRINEGVFGRFLAYGIGLGIVYGGLIAYTYITELDSIFLIIFTTFLMFPVIVSGAVLAIISGKYRNIENLMLMATGIGGGISLPQIFFYSILLSNSLLDIVFSISLAITAIFSNLISSYLIGSGIYKRRLLLYYNASIVVQFLVGITIISDYFFGKYSLFISLPVSVFSGIIYMLIIH